MKKKVRNLKEAFCKAITKDEKEVMAKVHIQFTDEDGRVRKTTRFVASLDELLKVIEWKDNPFNFHEDYEVVGIERWNWQ